MRIGYETDIETMLENYNAGLPVVAFRLTDEFKAKHPDIQQRWIQTLLRVKAWFVTTKVFSYFSSEIS